MSTLYHRRVLNNPTVTLRYSDPLVGLLEPSELPLELSNADHALDTTDFRGSVLTYSRFDALSSEQWQEMTGVVAEQTMTVDRLSLRCLSYDLDALQTEFPRQKVTAATFPKADPQQGLGRAIPFIWGICASTNKVNDAWEMPWVEDDTTSNLYSYLVGPGSFANVSVYRDSVGDKLFLVPSSEYTVNTAAFPGYTVIRFSLRQRNFSGGFHRLFVAADRSDGNRNFATCIKAILNDASVGLGLAVNAASFSAAASALPAGLYCDGALTTATAAIDVLSPLLMVWGMQLTKNTAGEYVLTVDSASTVVKGRFGHGLGQPHGGVTEFQGISKTSSSQAVKSVSIAFRKDRWSGQYLLNSAEHQACPVGHAQRISHEWIRNTTTADKVADYIAKRQRAADDRLSLSVGQRGRKIVPGDIIEYVSLAPVFTQYFRVVEVERTLTESRVAAVGWNSDIFTYSAQPLPAEPPSTTDVDYSRQTPTAPSSLSIATSSVEADGQGGWSATITLQYTIAGESWAQTYVRYRRTGTTNWQLAAQCTTTGNNLQTHITGMITNVEYDYTVERINTVNPTLAANATLTSQTTPADTVAPTAPTSVQVVSQHLRTLHIRWTPGADKDVDYWQYDLRTAADGGGTLITSGDTDGPGAEYTMSVGDGWVSYGTTYYVRIRGIDYSGNTGAYSSSASFVASRAITDDYGDTSITTPKRQLVNTQVAVNFTLTAGGGAGGFASATGKTFTVSGGVHLYVPSLGGYPGNTAWCYSPIAYYSSTQIGVIILNQSTNADIGDVQITYW